MNFALSEDHEALRDSAASFLDKEVDLAAADAVGGLHDEVLEDEPRPVGERDLARGALDRGGVGERRTGRGPRRERLGHHRRHPAHDRLGERLSEPGDDRPDRSGAVRRQPIGFRERRINCRHAIARRPMANRTMRREERLPPRHRRCEFVGRLRRAGHRRAHHQAG